MEKEILASTSCGDPLKVKLNLMPEIFHGPETEAFDEINAINKSINFIDDSEKSQERTEMTLENQPQTFDNPQEDSSFENETVEVRQEQNPEIVESNRNFYEDYLAFLKQRDLIKTELKNIVMIKDFQTKRAKFKEMMNQKPTVQKALQLKKKLENSDLPSNDSDIESVNQEIKEYEIWSQKVLEYLEKYGAYVIDDEFELEFNLIIEMSRGLNKLKEEANVLVLKDLELEKRCLIFEWKYQVKLLERSGKKGSMNSEINNWKELLIMAEDKKEILDSEKYKYTEKQIEGYQDMMKNVEEIRAEEQLLLKAGSSSKVIEALRKSLRDVEAIENLLQQLQECKIYTFEEGKYLKELLEKTNQALIMENEMKNNLSDTPLYKVRLILKQLRTLPIRFPKEIESQIIKVARVNELLQEVNQSNSSKVDLLLADQIFQEYKSCPFDIPLAQEICRKYCEAFKMLKTIEDVVKYKRHLNYEQIRYFEKQIENFPFDLGSYLDEVKAQIWIAKVDLIKIFKLTSYQKPEKLIPFRKISDYLKQGHEVLKNIIDKDKIASCMASLQFLKAFKNEIDQYLILVSRRKNLENEISEYLGFIDIKEEIAELKVKAIQRMILEQAHQYLLKKRQQSFPLSRTGGRSSHKMDIGDALIHQQGGVVKKLKMGIGSSSVVRASQELENEEEKVKKSIRKEARNQIYETVKKLTGFKRIENLKEVIAKMETEIYVRYRKQRDNYEKRLKSVCDFVRVLKDYNEIRRKVLTNQNFTYEGIRKYLGASVGVLQEEQRKLRSLEGKTDKSPITIEDFNFGDLSQNKLFQEIQKFSFDYMMSKQSSHYQEVYNRQKNDLARLATVGMMKNQRGEGSQVNQQSRIQGGEQLIFEGKISMRIIKSFWQSSDCSFFTDSSQEKIIKFPKIQGKHLIFEQSTKNTFFREMNNFVNNRQSQFQKVLAGWVVGKNLETDSFSKILDFLKGEILIGKCCYAPGFEIYLISYLLPITNESEPRASFVMCLTNEYHTVDRGCLGIQKDQFNIHGSQIPLQQFTRSDDIPMSIMGNLNCEQQRNKYSHKQQEEGNGGNGGKGSKDHQQNQLKFEPPSIALLYEQLSDSPSPKPQ